MPVISSAQLLESESEKATTQELTITNQPKLIAREPVWRSRQQVHAATVPANLWHWLVDTESLTRRIMHYCDNGFRVEVINQGWMRPMRNEAARLQLKQGYFALVRQVYLYCGDVPWVYARTIIPPQTLTGKQRCLAGLKSRSLGATLFADPTMQRDPVEITQLTARDKLFDVATRFSKPCPESIWGRRSIFRLSGKPLLVSEIFLPPVQLCRF